MAIEKRPSSFEAIRASIKKIVDEYRSARSPEIEGATTKTAIVRTGRFKLPKLRTLTTVQAKDGSGLNLEIQTKRGERPDNETVDTLRKGIEHARNEAAIKPVESALVLMKEQDPQSQDNLRTDIKAALNVHKAVNLRQRIVLSKDPIVSADANAKRPILSESKFEELASGTPLTTGGARMGADRVTMKVGPSISEDSNRFSEAVTKALEERTSRASLAQAVRSRTRDGRS